MKLSSFFDDLTEGDLTQIAVGGNDTFGIVAENYPKIIRFINQGLTELHTRFLLRTDEIIVQQYEQIQTYHLRKRFAQSNTASVEPIRYLMDSPFTPFTGNVLKIEQVFSEGGEERPINDASQTLSIFTPEFDTVSIPYNHSDNAFSVVYRADHPRIEPSESIDPELIDISLPAYLESALRSHVVGNIVKSMGGTSNLNEYQAYRAEFELTCQRVSEYNLLNKDAETNQKLERNGWV